MRALTAADVEGVLKPFTEATALPLNCYTDPELYTAEEERIFRREWLLVGRAEQVEKPGDFFTTQLMNEPLIVLRDDTGTIRCFSSVCRHRGHLLAEGSGHCRQLVCPYHTWAYGLDGKLLRAPGMDRTPAFDPKAVQLPELQAEEWLGFVFVNFDWESAPLGPRLTGLADFLAPWRPAEMRTAITITYQSEWDWKLMVENAMEAYHILGAHQETAQGNIPAERFEAEELDGEDYSLFHMPWGEQVSESDDVVLMGFPVIESLPDVEKLRSNFFHVYPTANLFAFADEMGGLTILPESHGRHKLVWNIYLPPEDFELPDFEQRLEAIRKSIDEVHHEDMSGCRGTYKGMQSSLATPSYFSHMEKCVWEFQRWYVRKMAPELGAKARR